MSLKSSLTPIVAGWVWISACEFGINSYWLQSEWEDYFGALGVDYPGEPMQLLVWAGWALLYALCLRMLLVRFGGLFAGLISWFMVFGLMFVALGNINLMTQDFLTLIVPATLAEAVSAALVMNVFVALNRSRARARAKAKEQAKAAKKAGTPVAA
ncbi:hypothetical protein SAMN05877809_101295 [Rhodobacter sp. JA431]|uniref:hypothetical protein n=1 Tax=Rhodobacter sp. JA431 TaxID=570013 RepID=UPI000BDDD468|nr:hypothetical protein [Rhodobacter sp. JA431]SOB91110.1 hypothetical protein SAMN05877809_101295 [Rhodobacter sp. JA431]